eukprot:199635-Amphidinium_carterae.1
MRALYVTQERDVNRAHMEVHNWLRVEQRYHRAQGSSFKLAVAAIKNKSQHGAAKGHVPRHCRALLYFALHMLCNTLGA